jgi:hypothetical protein
MVAAIAASAVVAASPGLLAVNVLQGPSLPGTWSSFLRPTILAGLRRPVRVVGVLYDVKPDKGSVDRWFQLTVDRFIRNSGDNVGLSQRVV